MKKICLLLIAFLPTTLLAELPATFQQRLAQVKIPARDVSLIVQGVEDKAPRWSHLPSTPRNPASVMKTVVSLAALDRLGPEFTWQTVIYGDRPPQNKTLVGNIYLKGGGDPMLNYERFWLLLNRLRDSGVQVIQGDVVVDNSLFSLVAHDPAAFDDQPLRPYNGGVDALMVNFNAITLTLAPDGRGGVAVQSEPMLVGLQIDNQLRIAGGGCGRYRDSVRIDVVAPAHISLQGNYPATCGKKSLLVAPMKNEDYIAALWQNLWASMGGRMLGRVRSGVTPSTAIPLAEITSPPLEQLLRPMNKYSNNLMAQDLFLTLGAQRQLPVTDDIARQALRDWMVEKGVVMDGIVVDNGSGLSRNNRLTAAGLAQLLLQTAKSPWMPLFTASVAQHGMASIMLRKMESDPELGHRVFLKSGHLDNVRGFAGMVLDRFGRWQVVVLFIQNPNVGGTDEGIEDFLRGVIRGEY